MINLTTYLAVSRLFSFVLLALFLLACRPEDYSIPDFPNKPEVPSVLKAEHEFLLLELDSLTRFNDSTGAVARELQVVIQHHFKEEENFVLPILGLLPRLLDNYPPAESVEIIQLSEKLKRQYNHMIAEHQLIKAFVQELLQEAKKEQHLGVENFKTALLKHAAAEEEIYFPTAILVGEYLKLKNQ